MHDIRCPGKGRSQQEMKQKHGISCLRLLCDENYIMASDFSGDVSIYFFVSTVSLEKTLTVSLMKDLFFTCLIGCHHKVQYR